MDAEAPTTVQETRATPEPEPAPAQEPAPAPGCSRCGAPLRPEQEWCLNCGAPTATRVASPAGWKVPVAIVASVLTLALAGLVVAFLAVSDDPDELGRLAQQTPTATPAPAPPPPAASPAPPAATPTPSPAAGATPTATPAAPGGATTGGWPAGEDAFTIVLASTRDRAEAERRAKRASDAGTPAGVLDSDDFKSLRAGYFVVFSGQYETSKEAEQALEGLTADAKDPYVRRITPR